MRAVHRISDYNKSEEISIYPSLTRLFMFRVFLCSVNYKFDYLVISTISQMHTHTRLSPARSRTCGPKACKCLLIFNGLGEAGCKAGGLPAH